MSLRPGAGSRAGTPRHFLVNGNEDHLGLIVRRTAKKKGQRRPSYMPAGSVVVRPPAAGSEMPQDRLEVPGRSASRQAEVPLAVVAPGLSQGRALPPGPASARQPAWSSRATRAASSRWRATRSCTARRPASPRSPRRSQVLLSGCFEDHVGVGQRTGDPFGDGRRVQPAPQHRSGARRTTHLNTPPSARPADRPSHSQNPRSKFERPLSTNIKR